MEREEFYRDALWNHPGPLDGMRVVEATTTWAGPMCGCLLADMGADVIKVEQPDGEVARRLPPLLPGTQRPLSFMHTTANRNKRSLTLNLREPEGRDLLLRLVEGADVFVENFRPGTLARWGLGYNDVRAAKPDIVYVSISGYGQYGPDFDHPVYDPIAQASSGWLSLNGEPSAEPVKAPTFISDDLAGVHAALAALGALRYRDRSGEGQHIDIALQDVLLFQSNGYLMLAAMGVPLPRMGSQFVVAAPAGVFRCRDGYVMAGVLLDAHWKILARLMDRPELADHPNYATTPARLARREEMQALLGDWLAERDVASAVAELKAARLPCSPVRTYAQTAEDAQVRARDMLQDIELEDGSRAPVVGPASKFARTPLRVRSAAPALGAHSEEILGELGVEAHEIARLRDAGVI